MDEQQSTAQHTDNTRTAASSATSPRRKSKRSWITSGRKNTREHFRNARIEMLKGMRSMLDARIDHLSKHEAKGTKVTVD